MYQVPAPVGLKSFTRAMGSSWDTASRLGSLSLARRYRYAGLCWKVLRSRSAAGLAIFMSPFARSVACPSKLSNGLHDGPPQDSTRQPVEATVIRASTGRLQALDQEGARADAFDRDLVPDF